MPVIFPREQKLLDERMSQFSEPPCGWKNAIKSDWHSLLFSQEKLCSMRRKTAGKPKSLLEGGSLNLLWQEIAEFQWGKAGVRRPRASRAFGCFRRSNRGTRDIRNNTHQLARKAVLRDSCTRFLS